MSSSRDTTSGSVKRWFLITGNRTRIAVGLAIGIVALSAVLTVTDVVYVRSGSNLSTALSSGLLSGLLTLLTVTLSINQLILSRVFGTPADLGDTVDGNIEFRERIEQIADVSVSPNEPSAFLALIGTTLRGHADQLRTRLESNRALTDEFEQFVNEVGDFGEHLDTANEAEDAAAVLTITLGTQYARQLSETRRMQAITDDPSPEVEESLATVLELLKAVATMRQFFKTLLIQQNLARLSRHLIYSGFASVLTTYYLSHVYTSASSLPPAIPEAYLPLVTSVAAGVIFLPLTLIIAFLLRIATVTLYTVSVGSFVPPVSTFEDK